MQKKISIVIPVLNEVMLLRRTLGQFARLSPDDPPHEIIVVDGGSNGSTIGSITTSGIVTATAPPGRAMQMNRGAALASGETLLFLHADTLLPAGGLSKISAALGDTLTAWGAFDLGIDSRRPIFRLIENAIRLRTRITRIPYGDQALFLTRPLFDSVGGFPEIPIMEDVELARKLHGLKPVMHILSDKVHTSPRRWETEGVVYCTLRNWLLITAYSLGVSPNTLAKYYRSQHLLNRRRWRSMK